DPYFNAYSDLLAALQVKYRLPLISGAGTFPILAYGPRIGPVARRAGSYVDAILKGAQPAELPVELPTTYDFVVRLAIAKAIGMTIPATVLAQASQLIE